MRKANSKGLLEFLFDQMDKLDNKEIDVQTARAQSELAKQANNVLNYEIKRAETMMSLEKHNTEYQSSIKIRDVEDI